MHHKYVQHATSVNATVHIAIDLLMKQCITHHDGMSLYRRRIIATLDSVQVFFTVYPPRE